MIFEGSLLELGSRMNNLVQINPFLIVVYAPSTVHSQHVCTYIYVSYHKHYHIVTYILHIIIYTYVSYMYTYIIYIYVLYIYEYM